MTEAGRPDLRFGVFYWIPDEDSSIDARRRHPFVIVRQPLPGDPIVLASPRTTSDVEHAGGRGFIIPEGVLPGFTADGMVYVGRHFRFPPRNFQYYECMGRLPIEWLRHLREAIDASNRRIRDWSEDLQ